MDYSPPGSFCPWESPGKNTGAGYHFLIQGKPHPGYHFLIQDQAIDPATQALQVDSAPLSHLGSPSILTYIFSQGRDQNPNYTVSPNHSENTLLDFPGGSGGKASAYNAGDPGLIPGSGRSPGEGKGNPL